MRSGSRGLARFAWWPSAWTTSRATAGTSGHGRRTGLVVVDMQTGVLDGTWRREHVVDNVARLVDAARRSLVPVIWVLHSDEGLPVGSEEWRMPDQLVRRSGDVLVHKAYDDAFAQTTLADQCGELGLTSLLICGARSDRCVSATVAGAARRGFTAVLVSDAHTTVDREVPLGASGVLRVPAEHIVAWQNHQASVGPPTPAATDAFMTAEVVGYLCAQEGSS